ncbi:MAG: hypothetical protein NXI22_26990 [bacterium]|nr:hypothetical protein [bacterium]
MNNDLDNLRTRRSAIYEELAQLDATQPGGKPNAASNESIDHVGYKDGLYRELKQINLNLDRLITKEINGAWEIEEHFR